MQIGSLVISARHDFFLFKIPKNNFVLFQVLPYLIQFLRTAKDDELRESALQCIETFLYRCPKEVNAFQTDVHNVINLWLINIHFWLQVLSDNLCYDPNYSYEGDDEEDEAMEVESKIVKIILCSSFQWPLKIYSSTPFMFGTCPSMILVLISKVTPNQTFLFDLLSDEEDGEADEDDYSDDDDMSYKVRRAAAKAIEAMVN